MRRALLLWGTLALTASPALAQERVYIPHITKEMQSRSRVAPRSDHTRALTVSQRRERNARPHVAGSRSHEARSVSEQRRELQAEARSPYTAASILGMRKRNAAEARSSSTSMAHARQRQWEAQRQAQLDLARATLQRQKDARLRESLNAQNLRDRSGEALKNQKRQAATRLATQRQGASSTLYRQVTMEQRRRMNRR